MIEIIKRLKTDFPGDKHVNYTISTVSRLSVMLFEKGNILTMKMINLGQR